MQPNVDAVTFLQRAQGNLAQLSGMELSGERVTAIKCYLTGEDMGGGQFNIRRLTIKDKHGLSRVAFNAKVNIYRESAEPILLGIQDKKLPVQVTVLSRRAFLRASIPSLRPSAPRTTTSSPASKSPNTSMYRASAEPYGDHHLTDSRVIAQSKNCSAFAAKDQRIAWHCQHLYRRRGWH